MRNINMRTLPSNQIANKTLNEIAINFNKGDDVKIK